MNGRIFGKWKWCVTSCNWSGRIYRHKKRLKRWKNGWDFQWWLRRLTFVSKLVLFLFHKVV
jgi:hypothetical protein